MFYAQLDENGLCFSIIDTPAAIDGDRIIPLDALDESKIGRVYSAGSWTAAPPASFEDRRQAALAALSARRYAVETGGTTFQGWPTHSGRETQAMVTACYNMAVAGLWSGGWKFADGIYRALTAQQVISLALTIGAHVQTAFAREAEIAAQIRAATDDAGLEWEW